MSEFHVALVEWICKYLEDKEVPKNAWILQFHIDDVQSLVEHKKWTPFNDSYLGFLDNELEEIIGSM